jgi:beta-lactam-binding protein with PASTA domain
MEPVPEERPGGGVRREVWLVLALVALAAVGVAAWLALRDDGGEASEPHAGTVQSNQDLPDDLPMPDLRGQPVNGAVAALVGLGLLVNTRPEQSSEPRGTVVKQEPKPRALTPPEETPVTLLISTGSGKRGKTSVPKLAGLTAKDAVLQCAYARVTCELRFVPSESSSDEGHVISHVPKPGAKVPRFDAVTLSVGR